MKINTLKNPAIRYHCVFLAHYFESQVRRGPGRMAFTQRGLLVGDHGIYSGTPLKGHP